MGVVIIISVLRSGRYSLKLIRLQKKYLDMNVTIHTSAEKDAPAFELLKSFGMPFRRK